VVQGLGTARILALVRACEAVVVRDIVDVSKTFGAHGAYSILSCDLLEILP
jgi:hypothetical protein